MNNFIFQGGSIVGGLHDAVILLENNPSGTNTDGNINTNRAVSSSDNSEKISLLKSEIEALRTEYDNLKVDGLITDDFKKVQALSDSLQQKREELDILVNPQKWAEIDLLIADEQAKKEAEAQARFEKERLARLQKEEEDRKRKIADELAKKDAARLEWKNCEDKLKKSPSHLAASVSSPAKQILNTIKNHQIHPATVRVELNDAFIKGLFRFSNHNFQQALNGKVFAVKEKSRDKKHGDIFSKITVKNAEGYDNLEPLNELERAVLNVIVAEYLEGNKYTTVAVIFRALIGKVGQDAITPRSCW